MKSLSAALLLTACVALFAVSSASASWVSLGSDQGVAVSVLESTPQRIALEFRVGGFEQQDLVIDGQTYATISLPGEAECLEQGLPELPLVARSVIIPDDRRMDLRVREVEYTDLRGITPAPSKGNLLRTVDPSQIPYTFGAFYGGGDWFPAQDAAQREPYVMRDFRGTTVVVTPFRYQPSSGTLRVATRMVVELVDAGPGGANVFVRNRTLSAVNASFDEVYREHFLNYQARQDKYAAISEAGSMLIICYDAFASAMQPFVDWKNQSGLPTTMVLKSEVGTTYTDIKAYIADQYNQSADPKLAFVLLVGDAGQIPTPTSDGGSADPTYGKIVGTDYYPEVFIGRFSAENIAQVETQVTRSVNYEKEPLLAGDAWYPQGTGIGSAQGAGIGDDGEADYVHIGNIRTDLLNYGYTTVDGIYDPGASASMVAAAVNNGRTIINYCGHGSQIAWSTSGFSSTHVNALTNEHMLPFIISVACVNGQFASGSCFAEAWLRATHNGNPTGGVAAYMSSINQTWAPPMAAQDEVVDLLVQDQARTYGALCFNGSCQMIDEYGSGGAAMFNTWHIFGDPSLRVRTQAPIPILATYADSIPADATTLEVMTDCPGAIFGLADSSVVWGCAVADSSGGATLALLDSLTVGQTLTLTVTGYNRIPHIASITVVEPPTACVLTCEPLAFEVTAEPDSVVSELLHVMCSGGPTDTLGFVLTFRTIGEEEAFLSLDPVAGRVAAGDTADVALTFSSRGLTLGIHGGTIRIQPEVGPATLIPVLLHVGGVAGVEGDRGAPVTVLLDAARPNPFSGSATLRFGLPAAQATELVVFDASGRAIRTLARGMTAAGYHSVQWNGRDEAGRPVPAGVYFARLETDGRRLTRRLLRIH